MTHIISFANQKGGVGKTTSAVNLAACVAALGHSTLLIDLDPQGNSSSGVGVNKKKVKYSMYEVILGECSLADAIQKTPYTNLSVAPATISLAASEFELISMDNRELALKKQIESLGEEYEYIFIDCPPSLSILTLNALTASHGVVIPMQCEYFALEGLTQLMLTIKKVKQHYNPALNITGILVTMYNSRLLLSVQVISELRKHYADKLFEQCISRNVKLSEAPGFGVPVYYHDKKSKGAEEYLAVAKELTLRI